ncbi:hypothetical protein DFJ58DRAFT_799352 [Suillus subalutaceus]|uniref:uncharacterized protein n=1 Tax=Suillus subalutaceus TaxID=48586 RepID=UPI001B87F387|nr:uncharacterized protein DFJ58DRAFT_799352 [Suillus subalutaceus]KAG1846192.1 hypothetical protein DFJ58DRAFT_799352 [Suillus subalutaceus]
MSGQEEQLTELLLTLKKTTPEQARAILASTPQIAYALIGLMVKMNAVDVQVLQKTLTAYSTSIQQQQPQNAGPSTAPAIQPASAIPPHLQQYRTPTPQSQTPPHVPSHTPTPPHYPNGHGQGPQQNFGYGAPSQYGVQGGYSTPQQAPIGGGMIPDALASIPDEQKAMIMRVIAMTSDQINMLPPTERASIIQLRATLGLPS